MSVFAFDEESATVRFEIKVGDETVTIPKDLWLLHDQLVTFDEDNRKKYADDLMGYDDLQREFFGKLGFPADLSYRTRHKIIGTVYAEVDRQKKAAGSPPGN